MLDANYLDGLPDELVKLFAKAERTILADMARRIKKYDCWLPSVEHQKRMLQLAGVMQEEIFTALSKLTGKTDAELKRLMLQAAKRMEQDGAAAYAAAGRQAPPFEKSENLRKILQSGYKNLQSEFKNICRTTAVAAARQFTEATDLAWMQVHSGAMSYDAAIRQACKGLAKEGLAAVQYPSGHKDTIETAVRRAVVTGVNHTCCDLALEEAKELGLDLVEVSAHEGARPEHALWQGKVYSISGKSEKYPSFYDVTGYGSGRGLGGWNCRHSFAPYVEGEPRVWSDEALEKLKEPVCEYQGQKLTEYEASQIQRRNERQIRRWKREYTTMEAAGQDTTKAATKIKKWQAEQENFLKETGRKRQYSREEATTFGYKQAAAADRQAEQAYREWSKSVGVDQSIKSLAKYYDVKYNDTERYNLLQTYVKSVKMGKMSPMAHFELYEEYYKRIQTEIVGERAGGIEITGQSKHFLERVFGCMQDPKTGKARNGVAIDTVVGTILNGNPEPVRAEVKNGATRRSFKMVSEHCAVSINPDTGVLIQVNPL